MTPPNPLQELAALCDCDSKDEFLKRAREIVGTLLQAERAATIAQAVSIRLPGLPECSFTYAAGYGKGQAEYRDHVRKLATPEAVSALSAVVQRETAKLRELLKWFTSEWSGICPCGILSLDADKPEFKHNKDCPYAVAKLALQ